MDKAQTGTRSLKLQIELLLKSLVGLFRQFRHLCCTGKLGWDWTAADNDEAHGSCTVVT